MVSGSITALSQRAAASEKDLFCRRIFPLHAEVLTSNQLLDRLGVTEPVDH